MSNHEVAETSEFRAIDYSTLYNDADRYDLITGALSGDGPVDFYRSRALRYGAPALELATGTGRLAIPIAQEGIEIVGLDASPEMLAAADRKAHASTLKPTWVHGDMRSFDLGRKFQFVFVASNSFSHLYSRADIDSCLRCVRRHLKPTGRLILEVFNPALGLLVRPQDHRSSVATYEDSRSGAKVSISKSVRYDSASQISQEVWYFRDEATGQEEAVPLNLRMFFPQEIDAVLYFNGFSIEYKYGDYTERPFDASSRKQIIVCEANQNT